MKTSITKIAICLFIVLTTIACKKENVNPTTPGSGTGLAPTASNTTFKQTMTVQINGTSWALNEDVVGVFDRLPHVTETGDVSFYSTTLIDGFHGMSTRDKILYIQMLSPQTIGTYNLRTNIGICTILYNDKSYIIDSRSHLSNKSHMQVQVLNVIQSPRSVNKKYFAADFNGVAYNLINANDSIIVKGAIRFK